MALIPPNEAQRKAILSEINLTADQLDRNVAILRTWVKQQPHLPQNISDTTIGTFIVQCKNRLEQAKERMEIYYSHRFSLPEFFHNTDATAPEIQKSFDCVLHGICRIQTPDGLRVQIVKVQDPDVTKYDPYIVTKRMLMVGDIRIHEEVIEGGEIIIYDFENCTFQHLAGLTPSMGKKYAESAKMVPMRLKKIIVINAPPALETIVAIFKTFISEKLQKRVFVYSGDHTNLYEHVPKHILPKDYGGDDLSLEKLSDYWRQRCVEMKDWFEDKSIQRSDESKRIGDMKYKPEQLFGVEGSFKSIAID